MTWYIEKFWSFLSDHLYLGEIDNGFWEDDDEDN